nr:hypothetical protein Iba_chr15dCG5090 [Ipomoea batatas]
MTVLFTRKSFCSGFSNAAASRIFLQIGCLSCLIRRIMGLLNSESLFGH